MSFPVEEDESRLHQRVIDKDPVVNDEVLKAFMPPILKILSQEVGGDSEDAYDSAIDALFIYLREPERFDRRKGRLCTWLTQTAKRRAVDRRRSRTASSRRDEDFSEVFELQRTAPKEALETTVEARLTMKLLEEADLSEQEQAFLQQFLLGERSTQVLAEVLGLGSLPELERRREVKRQRDRLLSMLKRLGREVSR